MRKLYEYNIQFHSAKSGRKVRVQQSAFSYEDAKRRIRAKYPDASDFKLLKRASYPHKIG